MSGAALLLAVFLACAVEAVEAATIVLAIGTTRGWRSTWAGVLLALLALTAIVAALGPALVLLPISVLRLIVGALLLVFGLQWIRKAVLRAGGLKALHDETAIYQRVARSGAQAGPAARPGLINDWYAFTVSFKGVLLEGLEVAFIVVTFAANQGNLGLAVIGAAAAVLVVTIAAAALRAPLASVPENSLKFVVGALLTSFGVFWSTEGAGVDWPGHDAALLVVIPAVFILALGLVLLLRRVPAPLPARPRAAAAPASTTQHGRLYRFGRFWYDFVIGDDWRIAAAIAAALAATAGLAALGVQLWWLPALAVATTLTFSVWTARRTAMIAASVSG